MDARNLSGPAYYRLKMVDLDETFMYSKIVSVSGNDEELAFVKPTIVTNGTLNLDISREFHFLELLNTAGNAVFKTNIAGKNGLTGIPVNTVSAGLYIVRLTAANNSTVQEKVVITP